MTFNYGIHVYSENGIIYNAYLIITFFACNPFKLLCISNRRKTV